MADTDTDASVSPTAVETAAVETAAVGTANDEGGEEPEMEDAHVFCCRPLCGDEVLCYDPRVGRRRVLAQMRKDLDESHRVSPLCISLQWMVGCVVLAFMVTILALAFT